MCSFYICNLCIKRVIFFCTTRNHCLSLGDSSGVFDHGLPVTSHRPPGFWSAHLLSDLRHTGWACSYFHDFVHALSFPFTEIACFPQLSQYYKFTVEYQDNAKKMSRNQRSPVCSTHRNRKMTTVGKLTNNFVYKYISSFLFLSIIFFLILILFYYVECSSFYMLF